MRNVIFAINTTLDGCCDHTKAIADEELLEHYTLLLRDAGLIVYGRKTYQLMVPYWPDIAKNRSATKAEIDLLTHLTPSTKLFFRIIKQRRKEYADRCTNLKDEILKLKQEQGKNILTGGVNIPSRVIELGLVDEYRFVVQPILAGEGRRLLEGIT